jgi:hypothetical protein
MDGGLCLSINDLFVDSGATTAMKDHLPINQHRVNTSRTVLKHELMYDISPRPGGRGIPIADDEVRSFTRLQATREIGKSSGSGRIDGHHCKKIAIARRLPAVVGSRAF